MLLAVNWWSQLIRGLAAIALGILTFAWPAITFSALVLVFGVYVFVEGISNIVGAVRRGRRTEVRAEAPWWALLLEGIAGIGAGIVTFLWPSITALVLVYVIATWALVTGAFQIAAAVRLRHYIQGEVLLLLTGILSIILAIMFYALPAAGALAIALWFGIYALVFGVIEVALAFRLRGWQQQRLAPA